MGWVRSAEVDYERLAERICGTERRAALPSAYQISPADSISFGGGVLDSGRRSPLFAEGKEVKK